MPVQVVDGHERKTARPGDRLGGRETDEQGADEPGPAGDGDAIDRGEGRSGYVEGLSHDRGH